MGQVRLTETSADDIEVAVLGAGAAGLGVAVQLTGRQVPRVVVFEKAGAAGESWRRRYEGLRLNTWRLLSSLPGERIGRSAGTWPTKEDFVAHLEAAILRHNLDVRFGHEVLGLDRDGDRYLVRTQEGPIHADFVVVATGYDRVPRIPDWPGRETYTAELIHASDYKSPKPYLGRDVLVVGMGNTGTEIATQLVGAGARRVRLATRRPVNIMPSRFLGVPITLLARMSEFQPVPFVDGMGFMVQRLAWGNLRKFGLARPAAGLGSEMRSPNPVVVIDKGFVATLKEGKIELVPGVEGFAGPEVFLDGGQRIRPEVLIAATGYGLALEPLLGHLGVLSSDGRPLVNGPMTHPSAPRLYFNGYWLPYSGQLPAMRRTSRQIARAISRASPRRK